MNLLYLTADKIGLETGGGMVTNHESQALRSMGYCETWDRDILNPPTSWEEPWKWDLKAVDRLLMGQGGPNLKLCHIYSGTWKTTVQTLKRMKCRVCITVAAHDKEVSRQEHQKLGVGFPYKHLTEEDQWKRYIQGYQEADCIICPSTKAAEIVRAYPCTNRIEVIPHGCDLPEKIAPLPTTFRVGYLGSFGFDKGIRYLLEAWKKLNYIDGSTLVLGGKESTSDFGWMLIKTFGGGNVNITGWHKDVSSFYNQINLYVQPSATEGFGLEVVEAMAHGRKVLCSRGAGAADLVPEWCRFNPCNADDLAGSIDYVKHHNHGILWKNPCEDNRRVAEKHTWDKIRQRYIDVWRSLL